MMKAQDWSAVAVMGVTAAVCLFFAIEAMVTREVSCLGRGCTGMFALEDEAGMFYFIVGGLLFLAALLVGGSVHIVRNGGCR